MTRHSFAAMALVAMAFSTASAQGVSSPMADVNGVVDLTLDSLNLVRTARPAPGSSRVGDNPVLFLVGNSTMRTGTKGNGDNGQWGWGYFAADLFNPEMITVENQALGGTSSRTFYNHLWPEVREGIRPGDWVFIELGHNDNGPYDSGRARASIPGIGTETLDVVIQETGVPETVYTYGEYMRRFINETRERGGRPVLLSLTPRKAWTDPDSTIVQRVNQTFGLWAKQVAEQEGVPFLDLNEVSASKFERFGKEKVKYMFYLDNIHTSEFGARNNAASAAQCIRECPELSELAAMLIPEEVDTITGSTRNGNNPVVFVIGDSTVKYRDGDAESGEGGCGWGSVFGELFNTDLISVENHAKAGRSARTFLDEGRWDKIYNAIQPGDFVLMQFGHNDAGDINKGKARAELPGSGGESRVFKMEATGQNKVIYTFGWYLRKFVYDVLEKGGIPIVISHTPRNIFDNGVIQSNASSFGQWTSDVAEQTGAFYIDLNSLSGATFQEIADEQGLRELGTYYSGDHTHTSKKGAIVNASNVAKALRDAGHPLSQYLK